MGYEVGKTSFRPLDGESISKRDAQALVESQYQACFRPLDGESISKRNWKIESFADEASFRPLDGESISKRSWYPIYHA